jgi:hypothetical protein
MISIGRVLKSRASQRGRNNCFLPLEMENGAPANFRAEPRPPGAGGVERSHGRKLHYKLPLLYIAEMMAVPELALG